MIIYIYDIKNLQVVARPVIKNYEEFKAEPTKFYPDWDIANHLSSETEFQNPIMDNGVVREKTREELILLDNKLELLQDGEYIENNKIIVVDPPHYLYKKSWNKETNIWEEGATQDEIDIEVNKLIDEFTILGEQKERWIKYGFDVLDIENQMAENIMKRNYLLTINPIL
ncbi:hypothetical protein HS141_16205 [Cetobacterium somerae]|uniref:hypothetical protein n=1 Tax=Cetobacterium somerae TaxID=188913 RepID=UPI00211E6F70|nr:hypothetical protein [Cetobacterium somerae]MCQ9628462.1 hypothetical protein [Cetobacterium somerae]